MELAITANGLIPLMLPLHPRLLQQYIEWNKATSLTLKALVAVSMNIGLILVRAIEFISVRMGTNL